MTAAEPLSTRLSNIAATLSQAEAVLELIACYQEENPTRSGATHGAATIIRVAIESIGNLEVEQRRLEQ